MEENYKQVFQNMVILKQSSSSLLRYLTFRIAKYAGVSQIRHQIRNLGLLSTCLYEKMPLAMLVRYEKLDNESIKISKRYTLT